MDGVVEVTEGVTALRILCSNDDFPPTWSLYMKPGYQHDHMINHAGAYVILVK